MMEIQIIQDIDDEFCDEEIAFHNSEDKDQNKKNNVLMEMDDGTTNKVNLAGSYILDSNQEPTMQDHFIDQVANSDGTCGLFSGVEKASDRAASTGPQNILSTFSVDGKSDVALPDEVPKLAEKSFNTDTPQYVIFSRTDQPPSVIGGGTKTDPQHFTLAVHAANETESFQNLPANIERHSGNNEKDGLNMIFEVVGEIETAEGPVLVREIATQTHPPQNFIRIDEKDSQQAPILNDRDSYVPDEKRFKCKSCGLKFFDDETRDVHQRCHRETMKDYSCCFCNFSTSQWTRMHTHLFKHGVEKPYKCDECSFSCKNKSDLTSHVAVHSNLKQFQCRKCGRQYKHRRNLVAHMRTCSGLDDAGKPQKKDNLEKFICNLCNRKLSTKKNLDKHMEIHTNVKPFECKICGHKTRLKESLLMHERLHTGEKPFKCSMCKYATPDRSSLRRHMRIHTKEKPYKCKSCSYSCIQKHCLDTHIRRKHTGEQFVCGLCRYATHDRYGLNQHFKRHQNTSPSQNDLGNITEGNQPQLNASFLNMVEDIGTTYVGIPSTGMLKSATEDNKLGDGSQISNPVILRIARTTTLDTNIQLGSAAAYSEKGPTVSSDDANACSINVNKPQEATVELASFEASLVQQIQQPGDEVYIQSTGQIIIKREDGHLLIIQRRDLENEIDNEVDIDDTAEQEYYAAVPLSDISPASHSGDCDIVQVHAQTEELGDTSSDQKLD